jgi:hypothetical protein
MPDVVEGLSAQAQAPLASITTDPDVRLKSFNSGSLVQSGFTRTTLIAAITKKKKTPLEVPYSTVFASTTKFVKNFGKRQRNANILSLSRHFTLNKTDIRVGRATASVWYLEGVYQRS